jgi:hypothetical protein
MVFVVLGVFPKKKGTRLPARDSENTSTQGEDKFGQQALGIISPHSLKARIPYLLRQRQEEDSATLKTEGI